MTTAQIIPLADGWGMHGDGIGAGWWILMVTFMVVFMGAMIWMMMRGMRAGSPPGSSTPPDRPVIRETPLETLERRFAEGEISIEDFRERRDALVTRVAEPHDPMSAEAMRGHCEETAARHEERSDPVATAEGGI